MDHSGPIPGTVRLDDRTFAAVPPVANSWTTIGGYQFYGMNYYDENPETPDAVHALWKLQEDPSFEWKPPVTSGSVDVEVSGTVESAADSVVTW
jgi:hypothetical protein